MEPAQTETRGLRGVEIHHVAPAREDLPETVGTSCPPWEVIAPYMTDVPLRRWGTLLDPKKAAEAGEQPYL